MLNNNYKALERDYGAASEHSAFLGSGLGL